MKLASLKEGGRDGTLVVAGGDLKRAVRTDIAATLQQALEDWGRAEAPLREVYDRLQAGKAQHAFDFDARKCASPLPRSYHWADGSA